MKSEKLPGLVFFHLPKTGGTSITQYLETLYPAESVCPHHYLFNFDAEAIDASTENLFFRGHFSVDILNLMPRLQSFDKITILRNPRSRILSLYNFYRSITDDYIAGAKVLSGGVKIAKNNNLLGFLQSREKAILDEVHNRTIQQFLFEKQREKLCPAYPESKDEIISEILKNLESFALIGRLEEMGKYFQDLNDLYGFPVPKTLPHKLGFNDLHVNQKMFERVEKYTDPTEEELSVLDTITEVDTAVYRHFFGS